MAARKDQKTGALDQGGKAVNGRRARGRERESNLRPEATGAPLVRKRLRGQAGRDARRSELHRATLLPNPPGPFFRLFPRHITPFPSCSFGAWGIGVHNSAIWDEIAGWKDKDKNTLAFSPTACPFCVPILLNVTLSLQPPVLRKAPITITITARTLLPERTADLSRARDSQGTAKDPVVTT